MSGRMKGELTLSATAGAALSGLPIHLQAFLLYDSIARFTNALDLFVGN